MSVIRTVTDNSFSCKWWLEILFNKFPIYNAIIDNAKMIEYDIESAVELQKKNIT